MSSLFSFGLLDYRYWTELTKTSSYSRNNVPGIHIKDEKATVEERAGSVSASLITFLSTMVRVYTAGVLHEIPQTLFNQKRKVVTAMFTSCHVHVVHTGSRKML